MKNTLLILFVFIASLSVKAQDEILTNSKIVKLYDNNVPENIIVSKMGISKCAFNLSTDSLIYLNKTLKTYKTVFNIMVNPKYLSEIKKASVTDSFEIERVYNLKGPSDTDTCFFVDDYLVVKISGSIDSLFEHGIHEDQLMLWIDNIPFPNIKLWKTDMKGKRLIFGLKRDSSMNSSWDYLYGYEFRKGNWITQGRYKTVKIDVGTDKKRLTYAKKDKMITINLQVTWQKWVGYLFIVLIVLFLIWLIKYKNILRDLSIFDDSVDFVPYFKDNTGKKTEVPEENKVRFKDIPYSLSRSQLFFWLFLVSISIIYIWLNIDELISITISVSILIGISGGTSVISKIIDTNQIPKTKLNASMFYKPENKSAYISGGFIHDILSDYKGYSIARVQLFVFTMFIGFYFCWFVIYYLKMPNFSEGLLLLMGLSSSTYAGVKYSEKPPAAI